MVTRICVVCDMCTEYKPGSFVGNNFKLEDYLEIILLNSAFA